MPVEKTNVMRVLDQKKVPYTSHQYSHDAGAADAETVAALIGADPAAVFKTLVTRGGSNANYVFVIPALAELELKKAARSAGEKSVALIHVKELNPLTGYVRGGCSPIGMKKRLHTVIDGAALLRDTVIVSAGRVGYQVELAPLALAELIGAVFADVT